jgi:hypothetical protein
VPRHPSTAASQMSHSPRQLSERPVLLYQNLVPHSLPPLPAKPPIVPIPPSRLPVPLPAPPLGLFEPVLKPPPPPPRRAPPPFPPPTRLPPIPKAGQDAAGVSVGGLVHEEGSKTGYHIRISSIIGYTLYEIGRAVNLPIRAFLGMPSRELVRPEGH